MSGPHVLELDDITVRRGPRDVVRAVSLNVYASERVALVGPNAAGKSTLLSAIAGLLPLEKGGIRLAGAPLSSFSSRQIARKRRLRGGFAGRRAEDVGAGERGTRALSPHRAVSAILRRPRPTIAVSPGDRGDRAFDGTRSTATLGSLSAGERQRALIARALAQEPDLLLLDEPSAHLDIGHGLDLFALLTTIAEARCVASWPWFTTS
jgi:iron complex transport system ATP-binding protein